MATQSQRPETELCEVPGADPARVFAVRRLLAGAEEYAQMAETFRSLANGSRARIVHSLLHQELCTCDLAAIVGLSESAVSQHLRVLRNRRVVKARREGRRVFYTLADAHIRTLLLLTISHLRDEGGRLAALAEPPTTPAPQPSPHTLTER
ncbi:MAG: ArsR/SmtB family transcription factor [Dehalococcoidia bacterium]